MWDGGYPSFLSLCIHRVVLPGKFVWHVHSLWLSVRINYLNGVSLRAGWAHRGLSSECPRRSTFCILPYGFTTPLILHEVITFGCFQPIVDV
jgi:hypothetical protein